MTPVWAEVMGPVPGRSLDGRLCSHPPWAVRTPHHPPPPTLEPTADRLRAAVREGVNGCVNE